MSQHDYNIANQGFPSARTDLNNALSAIATNNSGATAPASTFAHQWWYDSTANILKMRNAANNAWINIGTFNQGANSWRLVGSALSGIDANPAPDTTLTRTLGTSSLVWDNVFTRQINSGPLAGFRNAIINGNFDVWQRGTSFSNPASGAYLADRWGHQFDGTGSTRTISRGGTGVGQTVFPSKPLYYLRYDQSVAGSGATLTELYQKIESVETFSNQTISIRIGMRGNTALTLPNIAIVQNFGTGGSPSASVETTVASNVAITSSFVSYTFSVAVPSITGKTLGTNGDDCLRLFIRLPINTTFTFDITEVQIELGPVATPFERRPIGTELALCQRYYCKTFPINTVPGDNKGNTGALIQNTGTFSTAAALTARWQFPVEMRAAPTVTLYNPGTGTSGYWKDYFGAATTYDPGAPTVSTSSMLLSSATTAGTSLTPAIHAAASAEL